LGDVRKTEDLRIDPARCLARHIGAVKAFANRMNPQSAVLPRERDSKPFGVVRPGKRA
jgi:hypothetical protein